MAKRETVEFDGPPYEAAPSPGVDPDHAAYVRERAQANLDAAKAKAEVAKEQLAGAKEAVEQATQQLADAKALEEEAESNPSTPGNAAAQLTPDPAVSGSESPSVGG